MSKRKFSKEEQDKTQRKFSGEVTSVFVGSGFERISGVIGNFTFHSQTSDLDNVFVYENIIVLVEETVSENSDSLSIHLRKKGQFAECIHKDEAGFILRLCELFPTFKAYFDRHSYSPEQYILRHVYASHKDIGAVRKEIYRDALRFLDYKFLRYFHGISQTIKKSAKYEIFKFLEIQKGQIGNPRPANSIECQGFVLAKGPSGFRDNHFVASFYISPASIIPLAYVLRRDGNWKDRDSFYQRLLVPGKISSLREHLTKEERVFVNNVIVTLPEGTKFLNKNGDQINFQRIGMSQEAEPAIIKIPDEFNKIGIIDGQHRIFAYHEGTDSYESAIGKMRGRRNLLATGIIFPEGTPEEDRLEFESKLFLEINDKQSRVGSALRQDIQCIIKPFDPISIGKAVINRLAESGPLSGLLESHFFDIGKIKTSSIVTYGLKPLVNPSANGLFKVWLDPQKDKIFEEDRVVLARYVEFCAKEIGELFDSYRKRLIAEKLYVLDKKISRALSTTAINGMLHCLKDLIEQKGIIYSQVEYDAYLARMDIDFSPDGFQYKSSHWGQLGKKIYEQCFSQ